MNCKHVSANLSAYIDQELNPCESLLIDEHLATCAVCHQEMLAMRELAHLMRGLSNVEPDHDLADRILMHVFSCPVERTTRNFFTTKRVLVTSTACLTILLGAAIWQRGSHSQNPSVVAKESPELELRRDHFLQRDSDLTAGGPIVSASYVGR